MAFLDYPEALSLEDLVEIERCLVIPELVMRDLAERYGAFVVSDAPYHGGRWPSRKLRVRRGVRIYEVEVALASEYLGNRQLAFHLLYRSWISVVITLTRSISYRELSRYAEDQVVELKRIRDDLERALEGIFRGKR